MNRSKYLCSVVLLVFLAAAANATPLQIALDIQGQGLAVSEGGVGDAGHRLGQRGPSTVDIGGPVQAAPLYWAGRDPLPHERRRLRHPVPALQGPGDSVSTAT